MTELVLQLVNQNEEAIACLLENETFSSRLLDFFISLHPMEHFVYYNQVALPSFYGLQFREQLGVSSHFRNCATLL